VSRQDGDDALWIDLCRVSPYIEQAIRNSLQAESCRLVWLLLPEDDDCLETGGGEGADVYHLASFVAATAREGEKPVYIVVLPAAADRARETMLVACKCHENIPRPVTKGYCLRQLKGGIDFWDPKEYIHDFTEKIAGAILEACQQKEDDGLQHLGRTPQDDDARRSKGDKSEEAGRDRPTRPWRRPLADWLRSPGETFENLDKNWREGRFDEIGNQIEPGVRNLLSDCDCPIRSFRLFRSFGAGRRYEELEPATDTFWHRILLSFGLGASPGYHDLWGQLQPVNEITGRNLFDLYRKRTPLPLPLGRFFKNEVAEVPYPALDDLDNLIEWAATCFYPEMAGLGNIDPAPRPGGTAFIVDGSAREELSRLLPGGDEAAAAGREAPPTTGAAADGAAPAAGETAPPDRRTAAQREGNLWERFRVEFRARRELNRQLRAARRRFSELIGREIEGIRHDPDFFRRDPNVFRNAYANFYNEVVLTAIGGAVDLVWMRRHILTWHPPPWLPGPIFSWRAPLRHLRRVLCYSLRLLHFYLSCYVILSDYRRALEDAAEKLNALQQVMAGCREQTDNIREELNVRKDRFAARRVDWQEVDLGRISSQAVSYPGLEDDDIMIKAGAGAQIKYDVEKEIFPALAAGDTVRSLPSLFLPRRYHERPAHAVARDIFDHLPGDEKYSQIIKNIFAAKGIENRDAPYYSSNPENMGEPVHPRECMAVVYWKRQALQEGSTYADKQPNLLKAELLPVVQTQAGLRKRLVEYVLKKGMETAFLASVDGDFLGLNLDIHHRFSEGAHEFFFQSARGMTRDKFVAVVESLQYTLLEPWWCDFVLYISREGLEPDDEKLINLTTAPGAVSMFEALIQYGALINDWEHGTWGILKAKDGRILIRDTHDESLRRLSRGSREEGSEDVAPRKFTKTHLQNLLNAQDNPWLAELVEQLYDYLLVKDEKQGAAMYEDLKQMGCLS